LEDIIMAKFRRKSGQNNRVKPEPEKVLFESKKQYTTVKARNSEQAQFIKAARENIITICLGEPGVGKTYLSAGIAAEMLMSGQVETIVISRAAVEVGRTLGFLKGDLNEKFDPYMQAMLNELNYFIPTKEYIRQGKIILQPIQFIRGCTLKSSIVLVDEIQNLLPTELKAILSRIGEGSKYILMGDIGQSDLQPRDADENARVLDNLLDLAYPENCIGYVELTKNERHPIISILMRAFE
jgi:phosphate starvation-inducible PhoH-like protein